MLKATAPHPVPLPGGRVLAAGESADLDAGDPALADLLASGQLTPVQQPAAPVKGRRQSTTTTEEP